jgi:RHS repeat-associated protein
MLRAKDQGDNSVELTLLAFARDFCAKGSAYFNNSEIHRFSSDLRKFPLNEVSNPTLSGGYFDDGKVNVEHLHISVSSINSTGLLNMKIRAFTPHYAFLNSGSNLGYKGTYDYIMHYEALKDFADELELIANSKSTHFEFDQFNPIWANHMGVPAVYTNSAAAAIAAPTSYSAPGFPGQSRTLSDLYYNRNRDYDPSTGRYIQADPIGLDIGAK